QSSPRSPRRPGRISLATASRPSADSGTRRSTMQYRRFGKTEMNLSVLTLGLMRYMSKDPEGSAEVVRRAVAAGINHLETARGYADSEDLLGYALRSIDRKKVYITTKVGPCKTYDEFMKHFDTSMAKIGVD